MIAEKVGNKKSGEPCNTCGEDTELYTLWNDGKTEILGHQARCTNEWCYEPYSRTTYLEDLLASEYIPDDMKETLKRAFESAGKRFGRRGKQKS